MAIIFPNGLRGKGVTAGNLRQVTKNGYAEGGSLVSSEFITQKVAENPMMYFSKIEPAGVFMDALESTKQQINENADAILAAGRKLVDTARDANKNMADVTGKFRDGTEKLGNAIDKLMKVAGRGDFAETVKMTESLVDSLERLAILEEKGLLDKVMRAMHG